MARSILGTIGLAATVALAAPIALFGVNRLLDGETVVGAAAVGVAVLMLLVERYLTTPGDIPGKVLGATVGRVVKEPDEDDED
ncbi:DUF7533 family protein [Halosegnis marinus]|uniref:Uncharacterized protein n=1 Tax=Halosegnis marinus TaxID=3034023 RepID=A0ABD5ZMG4_9EURY|nr:hypothetical protein [Halosegnis sp. DT85]